MLHLIILSNSTELARIPLVEAGNQWYPLFDAPGGALADADPRRALDALGRVVEHLVHGRAWVPGRIHVFGFGQGESGVQAGIVGVV